MKQIFSTLMACLFSVVLLAQQYTDFIGAGHDVGVTVTTSHNQNANNDGSKSVDGFPIDDPVLLADASRFLAQATLGYDYEMMQMAAAMGYEAWLDEQLALPASSSRAYSRALLNVFGQEDEEDDGDGGVNFFRASWWNLALGAPDVLRQRITYSLSQIFVVSAFGSDLFEDVSLLSTGYYDVLGTHAFTNYRDLLSAVSRNPSMGIYLSHMNNPKSDPANNIHPDENYAREVMQLFSIGLYELNNDGSRKLDGEGNFIPTYNNDNIREFAKIFTGFGAGDGESWGIPFDLTFGDTPMAMYEEWHEPGPKYLLNGQVVPEGQSGLDDFENAMDNLYNHPNVGPFIGKALIQLLVSANPSPEYIERVASAFNNNGQGIRGDLKAVVKAILLDPEARNCTPLDNPTAGKLREPMLRYSGFLKAFNTSPQNGIFADFMYRWYEQTGQIPLYAASVFNFYQPEFQPNGIIADQNLVAPVFQIHNSSTSIGYINDMHIWTLLDEPFEPFDEEEEGISNAITLDYSDELMLIADATEMVNRLDLLLACGQLSESSKEIIINAIDQVEEQDDRLKLALYLILLAPEYAILK